MIQYLINLFLLRPINNGTKEIPTKQESGVECLLVLVFSFLMFSDFPASRDPEKLCVLFNCLHANVLSKPLFLFFLLELRGAVLL